MLLWKFTCRNIFLDSDHYYSDYDLGYVSSLDYIGKQIVFPISDTTIFIFDDIITFNQNYKWSHVFFIETFPLFWLI